jgi:hypothetical protein
MAAKLVGTWKVDTTAISNMKVGGDTSKRQAVMEIFSKLVLNFGSDTFTVSMAQSKQSGKYIVIKTVGRAVTIQMTPADGKPETRRVTFQDDDNFTLDGADSTESMSFKRVK